MALQQKLVRMIQCTIVFLLSGYLCSVLSAQQSIDTTGFAHTLWKVPDGLPEDTVQALVESSDGSLWIGTTGGLAKTGGARIRSRDIGLTKPLESSSISSLVSVKDGTPWGTLWLGTEGGGLVHLVKRQATIFSVAEGLTNGFVRSIFQDSRGQIWVGTDKGLFRIKQDRLERVDGSPSFPDIAVRSITEDRDGRMWFAGSRLISLDVNGALRQYAFPVTHDESRATAVVQTSDGTMWVGMVGGLVKLEEGQLQKVEGIHSTVRALLRTSDGSLWIGTVGEGLWTCKQGHLARVQSRGMLPSETILSLLQDHFGQIWVGTQSGLVRLEQSPMSLISLPDTADHDFETVSGDNAGNIWVATQKLFLIRDGKVQQANYGLPDVRIRNVFRASDGALWVGTDGSGVYQVRNGKIQHYLAPEQLTSNFIRGFMECANGDVWVASDEGISVIGVSGMRRLTEALGLAYSSTRALLQDHSGAIWIGTDRGLSSWKDGQFVQNEATVALRQEKVWSILQDRQGTLWFGTREHGLFRDRGGVIERYTIEQGLPTNSIYKVLQDRRGAFWISGPNVIFSLQEEEMDTAVVPSAPLNPVIYSIPAEGVQIYGGLEPAGYLAPDDSVWFPSNRGVARIAVGPVRSTGTAPHMVEIAESGQVLPLRTAVKVPAEVPSLSFRLGVTYLRPQRAVRIRYRLENLENRWTEARPEDTVTYANLKAGHYRLRVEAVDLAIPGAVAEAALDIEKAPYFYQTWWFYSVCAAGLTLIAWLTYRLRLRQLRLRFDAVLEERARLAREMHDTVIQSCTGISALLAAMENRATRYEGEDRELLGYAQELTKTTINQARQAVWSMRHGPEVEVDLAQLAQAIASQVMKEHKEIVVAVEIPDGLSIRTSMAHELIMAVREAVYNAVQHSGSERLTVKAYLQQSEVIVEIEDFGCGIDAGDESMSAAGHYGIVGMQERVKRLGGKFEMLSSAGKGTTVRIAVARVGAFGAATTVIKI